MKSKHLKALSSCKPDATTRTISITVLREILKQQTTEKLRILVPVSSRTRQDDNRGHVLPELFIQVSGRCDFEAGGSRFHLDAGEFCIMPRHTPHRETARGTSPSPQPPQFLTLGPGSSYGSVGNRGRHMVRQVCCPVDSKSKILLATLKTSDSRALVWTRLLLRRNNNSAHDDVLAEPAFALRGYGVA